MSSNIPYEPLTPPQVVPFSQTPDQTRQGVPLFGKDAPGWQIQTFKLDVATVDLDVPLGGRFLWAIGATGVGGAVGGAGGILGTPNPAITVKFNRQDSAPIPLNQGIIIRFDFGKLFLSWAAQPGATFTLVTSTTASVYIEQGTAVLLGNNNGVVERPTTITEPVDVVIAVGAAVQIRPIDPTRRRAFLTNIGPNPCRIGDALVAGNAGMYLYPGETKILMGNYAIFGIAINGVPTTIAVTMELD